MPASWAAALHGNAVPHQRTSPVDSRARKRSKSGRIEAARAAWVSDGTLLMWRVLAFAQIVRTRVGASISTSSSLVIAATWASLAPSSSAASARSSRGRSIGWAPASVTSLHHLDEERLRKRGPVDQHRVARTDLERVSAQHLGQPRDSRIGHGAGC